MNVNRRIHIVTRKDDLGDLPDWINEDGLSVRPHCPRGATGRCDGVRRSDLASAIGRAVLVSSTSRAGIANSALAFSPPEVASRTSRAERALDRAIDQALLPLLPQPQIHDRMAVGTILQVNGPDGASFEEIVQHSGMSPRWCRWVLTYMQHGYEKPRVVFERAPQDFTGNRIVTPLRRYYDPRCAPSCWVA